MSIYLIHSLPDEELLRSWTFHLDSAGPNCGVACASARACGICQLGTANLSRMLSLPYMTLSLSLSMFLSIFVSLHSYWHLAYPSFKQEFDPWLWMPSSHPHQKNNSTGEPHIIFFLNIWSMLLSYAIALLSMTLDTSWAGWIPAGLAENQLAWLDTSCASWIPAGLAGY